MRAYFFELQLGINLALGSYASIFQTKTNGFLHCTQQYILGKTIRILTDSKAALMTLWSSYDHLIILIY